MVLSTDEDLLVVIDQLKTTLRTLGFEARPVFEFALAVKEVGSNAILHGRGGTAEIRTRDERVGDQSRVGLEIEISDNGPGIADIETAFRDGYSTKGSLGVGLGAAKRLTDDIEIDSRVGVGTRVRLLKWLRKP